MSDPVNHPAHYNQGSVECIDAIRSALGDAFPDYCVGNAMKYEYRWRHKGGVEDLKKAIVYLQWAVEAMEAKDLERTDSYKDVLGYSLEQMKKDVFEIVMNMPIPESWKSHTSAIVSGDIALSCEPANTSETPKSCEPEKQYRDVTEADIGDVVEVKWNGDWRPGVVLYEIDYKKSLPFFCDNEWHKYARIEVTS